MVSAVEELAVVILIHRKTALLTQMLFCCYSNNIPILQIRKPRHRKFKLFAKGLHNWQAEKLGFEPRRWSSRA